MYAFLVKSTMTVIKHRCETEIEEVANNLLSKDKKNLLKAVQDYDRESANEAIDNSLQIYLNNKDTSFGFKFFLKKFGLEYDIYRKNLKDISYFINDNKDKIENILNGI